MAASDETSFPSLLRNTSSTDGKPPGFSRTAQAFLIESSSIQQEISMLSQVEFPPMSSLESSRDESMSDIDFARLEKKDWLEVYQDLMRKQALYEEEILNLKTQLGLVQTELAGKTQETQSLSLQLASTREETKALQSLTASLHSQLQQVSLSMQEHTLSNRFETLAEQLLAENVQLQAKMRSQAATFAVLEEVFRVSGEEEMLKGARTAAEIMRKLPLIQRFVRKTVSLLLGKAPDSLEKGDLKAALRRLKALKRPEGK